MSSAVEVIAAVNRVSIKGFENFFKSHIQNKKNANQNAQDLARIESEASILNDFRFARDTLEESKDHLDLSQEQQNLLNDKIDALNAAISSFGYIVSMQHAYTNFLQSDIAFSNAIVSLRSLLVTIELSIQHAKNRKIDNLVSDLDNRMKEVERLSAGAAISEYARIYSDDKDASETTSEVWLFVTFLLAAITFIFCYCTYEGFFDHVIKNPHIYEAQGTLIFYALSKLFITLTLLAATFWAARMFKIEKNLAFINRQKENALNTIKAFHNAAGENQEVREAILMEATRSIFSSNNTGLIHAEGSSDDGTKIIEIVRNVSSAAKS